MRIVIVGSGRVAGALANALAGVGMAPVQVWARNRSAAAKIAEACGCPYSDDPKELAPAEVYLLAVSDKAIKVVAGKLKFGDAVVAHTAGSVEMDALLPLRNRAVLYPMQTFSEERTIDVGHIPIFIEGSNRQSLDAVRQIATALTDNVHEIDSTRRMILHTAAVFANNFTNHMYTAGEELAREAGFDFEILKPLIMETAAKALDARSPRDVQTGPAVRNDFETRSRHTELLSQKPYLQNLYINISKNIWETSKKT